jgi:hypothetical protein
MQTIICSLIIFAAVLYVANRWLPAKLKQRLMPGKSALATKPASGSCSSCSSCGNCGSDSIKLVKK